MTWYVRRDGRLIGWVIAATEAEAMRAAREKFPTTEWGLQTVHVRAGARQDQP
jgi:hypothetical protein